MKQNITPQLICAALQFIPANLPRDEWARIGMAIKSEFADGTGLDLFAELVDDNYLGRLTTTMLAG